ncbi:MAG: redoxin domain-containing protein [Armatimonadetes bacterium]|nr:redoxin domain-containing protein [Armatimonadota bacterium]
MRRSLATWAALIVLTGPGWAQELDAEAILARVAQTYAQVEDLSLTGKASADMRVFGMRQRVSIQQTACFQRPNRLRLASTMSGGGGTRTVVCDGRHVYAHQDVTREYTRHPAPGTLREIRDLDSDAPADFGEMIDLPSLLDGVDLSERVEQATVERTGVYSGAPVYVLSLALKGGHTERMWIGRDDFLVRKLEFRLNPEGMLGAMAPAEELTPEEPAEDEGEAMEEAEVGKEFGEALLGAMTQAFKMELTWVERYQDVRVNGGVSSEAFRFRPRAGDRRVEQLSEVPMPEPEPMPLPAPGPGDLTGQVAPDFTLPDLDGTSVTLSQLRGRPVLLYFWDSLCVPCLAQLPDIQALHLEQPGEGLQVVGLNVDRTLDMAKESAEEAGLTFPVLWQDPESPAGAEVSAAYRPEELPRLLVIDAIGIVRADLTGYHDREAIEAVIAAAQ